MNGRRRVAAALLAVAALLAGCGHHPEITRLQIQFRAEALRGNQAETARIEKRLLELAAEDYPPDDPAVIRLRAGLAEGYGYALQTERALSMAEQQVRAIESFDGSDSVRALPPRFAKAWTLVFARRWTGAEREADALASTCHRAEADGVASPLCLSDLDDLYQAAGACHKANAEFLRADERGLLRDDRPGAISALTLIARRYVEFGHLPEARWYLRRCVAESEVRAADLGASRRVWNTESGDVTIDAIDSAHAFDSQAPRCLEDLVFVERRTGNERNSDDLERRREQLWARGPDLGEELQQQVQKTRRAWTNDNLTAADLNTLAWYFFDKGRVVEAIVAWKEAAGLLQGLREKGDRHPSGAAAWRHADVLLGLAGACQQQDRLAEAAEAYRQAEAIVEAEMHPAHAWRLDAMAGLAAVQQLQGSPEDAEETWRRYLTLAAEVRGEQHPDYARGLAGLAGARESRGLATEARRLREASASLLDAFALRMDAVRDLPLPAALRSPPSPANYLDNRNPAALP